MLVRLVFYNAVREPDGTGYALNRGIETRQQRAFLTEYCANLGGAEWSNSGDIDTTVLGEELELPALMVARLRHMHGYCRCARPP